MSTVEPLSDRLRESMNEMVDTLGSHLQASAVLEIGAGTLSTALKHGAGRNLRGRLERGYVRWLKSMNVSPPAQEPSTATGSRVAVPSFPGFQGAADNAERLKALAHALDRVERKLDAILIGLGGDPAEIK